MELKDEKVKENISQCRDVGKHLVLDYFENK